MISIILVNVWRNLPFSAVVLTAGISAVPQEILEAANLDGANWWVRWRKVIVPIIAPILYIALLFSLVFTFTDMTVVWLMTRGNPVGATHVIASYAFQTGVVAGSLDVALLVPRLARRRSAPTAQPQSQDDRLMRKEPT